MKKHLFFSTLVFLVLLGTAHAQDKGWKYSGSIYILTTPQGADLPATASEADFPLLVRLDKGFFDFRQAKPNGEDIRFATGTGAPLAYQIDAWDAAAGTAGIWVRIPAIKGNARQEIKLRWGKADAASESSGAAVFNESNGYLSVWHMNDPVQDEVGALESKDTGTTSSSGIIGSSRRLDVGKGINCGEKITGFPTGSSPHSSEVWFKAEKPNATVLAWGNEAGQGKVMLQARSPCLNGFTWSTPSRTVIQGYTSMEFLTASRRPRGPRWRSRVPRGCILAAGTTITDLSATLTRCASPRSLAPPTG
jgi:hypothetical protein